nr:restriction endonuclease subunit S [Dietzia aerolata]
MAALGDVASIDRKVVPPNQIKEGTTYLGLEHLERGGRIAGHETIGDFSVASAKHSFTEEHILFGKLRPNLGKIARPVFSGICSTDLLPIKSGSQLERSFLFHYLSQDRMIDHAASRASGANLPRLSPAELLKFPVPLPPLDEQRRIAAILDQAELIHSRQTQSQQLTRSVPQAVFREHFGDVSSRSKDPVPLHDVIENISSGKSLKCETRSRDDATNEPGILKLSAITQGVFKPHENKAFPAGELAAENEVRRGDLLMCRKNTKDLVGTAALVDNAPSNLYLPDLIYRIDYDKSLVTGEYLLGAFRTKEIRRDLEAAASGSSASMANISRARLLNIVVHIPPIEDQLAYATRLRSISAYERRTAQRLEALDALVDSLQSRAFRGEL